MGMRVSFDLDDDDLKHFRLIMREARKAAARSAPEDIVEAAERRLGQVEPSRVPTFVRERIEKLDILIQMLTDHQWRLPKRDANRVLNALAYFADPEDLIPDHIPGLGFLDDAIMIELVVRELRHEIDAYQDFCHFRKTARPNVGVKAKTSNISREDWLEARRKNLLSRMHRRRKRNLADGDAGPSTKLL